MPTNEYLLVPFLYVKEATESIKAHAGLSEVKASHGHTLHDLQGKRPYNGNGSRLQESDSPDPSVP